MKHESVRRARVRPGPVAARLLLAFCCAASCAAARAQGLEAPAARKVSEYVNQFSSCNAGAHLDLFATELQKEPGARAYIVVYGPGGAGDAYAGRAMAATKSYLVSSRGLDESLVVTKYGGAYQSKTEQLTELWLVPDGAPPPAPTEYANDAATFEGKFADFETADDTYIGFADGEGWSHSGEVMLVGFTDVLRRRAGTLAYVVVFDGEETAPGAWRRIAESESAALKEYGVAAERVRVIFGGYREAPAVQLWVLPRDAPPPAKDAGRERRPTKAAQLGAYDQYVLRYPELAGKALKQLGDVLKSDESLTAHLIVRLAPPEEPKPVGDESSEKGPDETPPPEGPEEPPDVDLAQLAEKWRGELKKQFGVGEQRVILTFVPPGEDTFAGSIESWLVPPGAAAPNPFVVEEEEAAEPEPGANPREFYFK